MKFLLTPTPNVFIAMVDRQGILCWPKHYHYNEALTYICNLNFNHCSLKLYALGCTVSLTNHILNSPHRACLLANNDVSIDVNEHVCDLHTLIHSSFHLVSDIHKNPFSRWAFPEQLDIVS